MRYVAFATLLSFLPFGIATAQSTWTVDRNPILDVPGVAADGKVNFGYAAGATRLADGTLLVADRAESAVRVIDASGRVVRTLGRAGQGPNEFASIVWAGGCGNDTLLVWDLGRRQASMVGANGIGRQFTVPAGDTAQMPYQFSCARNRTMAYVSAPRPDRSATTTSIPNVQAALAAVYRVNSEGAVVQRLGTHPGGEVLLLTSPGGGRGGAPRPLGRAAYVAAVTDAIVISSADSAHLTVVPANGPSRVIKLAVTLRAPTRAEYDAAVQATASMVPAPMRQTMTSQLAASPMPERLPPVSALFSDPAGLLWVQTSPPGASAIDLLVMQLDGHLVARVRIPRAVTIHEIGNDYIVAGYADANDEPHVAVFGLKR
jgi:hypothetical protein